MSTLRLLSWIIGGPGLLLFSLRVKVSGAGFGWMSRVPGSFFFSSHQGKRDKMQLRSVLCGGVWNGFCTGKSKKEDVACRFCGRADGDGHLFWDCQFLSWSGFGRNLSLLHSWLVTEVACPRWLAWHGWLPMLTARRVEPSWAVAVGDGVDASLEVASSAFPLDPGGAWNPGRNPEDVVFSFS